MAENKLESIVVDGVEYDIGAGSSHISEEEISSQEQQEEIIIGEDENNPAMVIHRDGVMVKSITDLEGKPIAGVTDNLPLLFPHTIYNVGNNISIKAEGFPRNFCASLYLDNFLPDDVSKEPNMRFGNGLTMINIPCYEPRMQQIQGLGNSWETPKMNNAENEHEEILSLSIVGNHATADEFEIKNRCILNTASKGKNVHILIIGDSVTFGQNAYFEGNPNKANYTLLLEQMFQQDNLQSGSNDYNLKTIGTISYTRKFQYGENSFTLKSYNEGYSGTTLKNTGLYNNPKFLDADGNFSFQNWLDKFRTKDDNGNQLYFTASKETTGVGGNYGYLENGTQSTFKIGTEVTNVLQYSVYKPTHVFLFHGSNEAVTQSDYDTFIARVRSVFPNAIIGLGVPHAAGTAFPSQFPNYVNAEIWSEYMNEQIYLKRHYNTAKELDKISADSSYEANKVFVVPTYFVNPAAKGMGCMAINEPYRDFIDGENTYIGKGQAPDVHVGGIAHAAYAYQLYAWIKWTIVKQLF